MVGTPGELQTWLTFKELRELAQKSDRLFADAFGRKGAQNLDAGRLAVACRGR